VKITFELKVIHVWIPTAYLIKCLQQ